MSTTYFLYWFLFLSTHMTRSFVLMYHVWCTIFPFQFSPLSTVLVIFISHIFSFSSNYLLPPFLAGLWVDGTAVNWDIILRWFGHGWCTEHRKLLHDFLLNQLRHFDISLVAWFLFLSHCTVAPPIVKYIWSKTINLYSTIKSNYQIILKCGLTRIVLRKSDSAALGHLHIPLNQKKNHLKIALLTFHFNLQ